MNDIGHNNPPGMVETAASTTKDISDWMAERPAIDNEDMAREAKVYLDRGKLCLKDLDDERKAKVGPLNAQVEAINTQYRGPRDVLHRIIDQLSFRLSSFIRTEEMKRQQEAAKAAEEARVAEEKARAAALAETDALESAGAGELGVDIADVIKTTDAAIKDAELAARRAALAERESHVKIGGGFTRAISLRSKETLIITNGEMALRIMGITQDIHEAMCKSARAYRKLHGKLPSGIEAKTREEI